jgi:two-component system chemotaxis response regulator CheB
MAAHPCPIVIISAQAGDDVELSMRGLAAGALTVLAKPPGPASPDFAGEAAALAETVKLMSEIRVVTRRAPSLKAVPARPEPTGRRGAEIIAIAASTGGPNALARVLAGLPHPLDVPVLVVQHMTDGFHLGLAAWLDSVSPHDVRLAVDREPVRAGMVLVAPGGSHLGVTPDRRVELRPAAPINGHRPAATHLFTTIATAYARRAVGVILTGDGRRRGRRPRRPARRGRARGGPG